MMSCARLARFCLAAVCISLAWYEALGSDVRPAGTSTNCQTVRQEFARLNIGHGKLVPDSPVHDAAMEVCYKGKQEPTRKSCCTRRTERKYHRTADEDMHAALQSTSSYLKNLLSTNLAHYEGHFLSLIREAQNQTETVFTTNYGRIPQARQHALVKALFDDITVHIKRRHLVNTANSVTRFFDGLFPLVFENILNDPSQLLLTPPYRECLRNMQQELRPFGDTPHKFAHRLTKSTGIVRAFLGALSTGFDTLNATENLPLEMSCTRALTRMLYCPHCDGLVRVRPCRNLCYNVARGCLAGAAELDRHWNSYIVAVETVAAEMKGYYNPEEVLASVAMTISEAVMHTMETGHKYYTKVVDKCGHLRSTHTNVTLAPQPIKLQPDSATSTHVDGSAKLQHPGKSNELSGRMSTFVHSLASSKGFFRNLADILCKSGRFSAQRDQQCWNGHALAPYNKTVPSIGIERQMASNPEVRIQRRTSATVVTLVDKLIHVKKTIDSKSSTAPMQADEWVTQDDTETRSSGGGRGGWSTDDSDYSDAGRSGSGSGDRNDDYWDGRPPYRTDGGKKQPEEDIYVEEGEDKSHSTSPPPSAATRWQYTPLASLTAATIVSLVLSAVASVTG